MIVENTRRYWWLLLLLCLAAVCAQSQEQPICDPECQNEGVCKLGFGVNETETGCLCPKGTLGDLCETVIPSANTSEPGLCGLVCRNGGECESGDAENPSQCNCPPGTSGSLCEILVEANPCVLKCFNGGECVEDDQGGSTCQCVPGTSGLQCEEMEESSTEAPSSSCPPGTSGDLCQSEAPTVGQATTQAPSSLGSSSSCDLITCQNGGRCEVLSGSNNETQCICDPGFSGDLCETAATPEELSPQEPQEETSSLCDLDCKKGGLCVSSGGDDTGEMTCNCPPGTSGELCEEVDEVTCGENTCYHGSQCITASDGGLHCDCTTINDPERHYAGRFCQYQATTYCGDGEDYFCVNGGKCRDENNGAFSCECSDEWSGPSCEFESETRDHEHKSCTLNCLNGGQCRKGGKDLSAIDGLSADLEHLAEGKHSENVEHCVCPKNFAGKRCEHRYEECGNAEHMCLHGSKCVPPKDDESHPSWTCECDDRSQNFCQHHRSSVCTSSDIDSSVYRGLTSLIYCVNDGVCMTYEQDGTRFPACKCPPQYTGAHCELLKAVGQNSGTQLKTEKESAASLFAAFIVCILLVVLVLFFHVRRRRQQSSQDKTAIIRAAQAEQEESEAAMMEEVDFEGVMEDVELL